MRANRTPLSPRSFPVAGRPAYRAPTTREARAEVRSAIDAAAGLLEPAIDAVVSAAAARYADTVRNRAVPAPTAASVARARAVTLERASYAFPDAAAAREAVAQARECQRRDTYYSPVLAANGARDARAWAIVHRAEHMLTPYDAGQAQHPLCADARAVPELAAILSDAMRAIARIDAKLAAEARERALAETPAGTQQLEAYRLREEAKKRTAALRAKLARIVQRHRAEGPEAVAALTEGPAPALLAAGLPRAALDAARGLLLKAQAKAGPGVGVSPEAPALLATALIETLTEVGDMLARADAAEALAEALRAPQASVRKRALERAAQAAQTSLF